MSSPVWLCQCLCPQACLNYLSPLLGAPQHQQNSLISLLSNCCLCSGTQSMCDFATPFKSESLFPIPLQFSYMQTLLIFKGRDSGGSCSQCKTLGLRSLIWDQTPSSLERTSAIVIILLFVGVGLNCTTPLSHCGFFFISLVVERSFLLVFWSFL